LRATFQDINCLLSKSFSNFLKIIFAVAFAIFIFQPFFKMDKSPHVASLIFAKPFYEADLGSMRRITSEELPILKNLSIKRLVLEPGSIREPHWHANCNELTYCISGTVLVTQLDVNNEFVNCTISAGQMFFVKAGALHHIENVGDETAELIIAFRHEMPEDFSLSASFGAMSDAVSTVIRLYNTFR
jgi:oxalate decarboxylase